MSSHRVSLPPAFVESARAFRAEGREPAEPRDAATVVLLRAGDSGAHGPEVFLLRRAASMAFAGGMYVFPGGGVDPRDFDQQVGWAGPSAQQWAHRLGTDPARAAALVCAAVRETFEECGVLLAGEGPDTVVADTTGEHWERDRQALEARELAFTDFLEQRGLVLRSDLLTGLRGWLTPEFEPRRYRTWFFVAALPEGQRTGAGSRESDDVAWVPAMRAVERVEAGEVAMLPPTYQTCLEVGQYAAPDDVRESARDRVVEMFTPDLVDTDDTGDPGGTGATAMTSPDWMQDLLRSREARP